MYHGERIKEVRKAHATLNTRKALSEATGVSTSTIQRIESGETKGKGADIAAIYIALGIAWQLADSSIMMTQMDTFMGSRQANRRAWTMYIALPPAYKVKIEELVVFFFEMHLAAYGANHKSWKGPMPD